MHSIAFLFFFATNILNDTIHAFNKQNCINSFSNCNVDIIKRVKFVCIELHICFHDQNNFHMCKKILDSLLFINDYKKCMSNSYNLFENSKEKLDECQNFKIYDKECSKNKCNLICSKGHWFNKETEIELVCKENKWELRYDYIILSEYFIKCGLQCRDKFFELDPKADADAEKLKPSSSDKPKTKPFTPNASTEKEGTNNNMPSHADVSIFTASAMLWFLA